MSYYKESQKKYAEKIVKFTVKFGMTESEQAREFKQLAELKGITVNAYLKELVLMEVEKNHDVLTVMTSNDRN